MHTQPRFAVLLATTSLAIAALPASVLAQPQSLSLLSGAQMRVADSPDFANQAFTLAAWIKPLAPTLGGDGTIITKIREGANGNNLCSWWLGWSSTTQKVTGLVVHEYATSGRSVTSNALVPIGQRAHAALTFDGTTLRLYIDGQLDSSQPFGYTGVYYGSEPIILGASNLGAGFTWYYQGLLDDVRVWNRALSDAEVAQVASCDGAGSANGLVAAWSFSGNSFADASGHGHDGLGANGPTFATQLSPVCCPADLDNDGVFPGGAPDGGVDINDLLYFLAGFEAGAEAVDLDNGTGTGTPDGGVDINDLLFFLTHFEAGC